MPLVTLSQKELHRLEAIQKIRDRRLSVVQASARAVRKMNGLQALTRQ